MIMAGYRWQGGLPFKNVFFNGIIRDKKGEKMSKQRGNSPDPLDLIEQYGADALRFAMLKNTPTGGDMKYEEKHVEEGRNFATKIWNASRYREMQGQLPDVYGKPSIYAVDIVAKLETLQNDIENSYTEYKFNEVAQLLYEFWWNNYCDWYLESAKGDFADDAAEESKAATLATMDAVLERFLMLLHPYMPHITEELWERFGFKDQQEAEFLMNTPIPEKPVFEEITKKEKAEATEKVAAIYESVTRARNLKASYGLAASKDVKLYIDPEGGEFTESEVFGRLAGAKEVIVEPGYEAEKGVPVAICSIGKVYLPLEGLIDVDVERERLSKELKKAEGELQKVEAKLGNEKFTSNAPEKVIQEMEERKVHWSSRVEELGQMIENLG